MKKRGPHGGRDRRRRGARRGARRRSDFARGARDGSASRRRSSQTATQGRARAALRARRRGSALSACARLEDAAPSLPLAAMACSRAAELVTRAARGSGVPGAGPLVQHLTLWVGFLGAAVAAREGQAPGARHRRLPAGGTLRRAAAIVAGAVGAAVATLLARACWELVRLEREAAARSRSASRSGWRSSCCRSPSRCIALRLVWRATRAARGRALAALGSPAGCARRRLAGLVEGAPVLAGLAVVLLGTAPARRSSWCSAAPRSGSSSPTACRSRPCRSRPTGSRSRRRCRRSRSSPSPASCSPRASRRSRLLALFRALVGWLPGGTAVVVAVLCAFFTTFTGGSGVTILALGALLFRRSRRERLPRALLARPAHLRRLARPALPAGAAADLLRHRGLRSPIPDLFIGGILPGLLLVGATAAWGVREGRRVERQPPALLARRGSAARVVGGEVGDLRCRSWSLVAAASRAARRWSRRPAAAALYAGWIVGRRSTATCRSRRAAAACCATASLLIGGVLLILGVAIGLTSYLVDAQVPTRLLDWAQANLASKFVFLLGAQPVPARRRLPDGHLLGDRGRRAADRAARPRLRRRSGPPRHHLHRQPRARLPDAAGGGQPLPRLLPLRAVRCSRSRAPCCPGWRLRAAIVLLITYVPFLTLAFLDR